MFEVNSHLARCLFSAKSFVNEEKFGAVKIALVVDNNREGCDGEGGSNALYMLHEKKKHYMKSQTLASIGLLL